MKAIIKHQKGVGNVKIDYHVTDPQPCCGEVRIKVKYAGVCGTDIHIYNGKGYNYNTPVILGHEFSGIVDKVSENVSSDLIGKRVVSETYYYTCGKCNYCKTGKYNLCLQRRSIGSHVNGAFADYVIVPETNVHLIPDNVSYQDAALTEPLACCCQAVFENAQLKPKDYVLVTGPGSIGLLCLQLIIASGSKCIMAGTEKDSERLELALKLGAEQVLVSDGPNTEDKIKRATGGLGVDHSFDCSGSEIAIELCLKALKKGGRHIQVGLAPKKIMFDINMLTIKEIKTYTSFAQKWEWWDKALRLLSEGVIKTDGFYEIFPLKQYKKVFESIMNGEGVKFLLEP